MSKLTKDQFVLAAIDNLPGTRKDGQKYRGIHTVFSGFNAAYREYFEGSDPVEHTKSMQEDGSIVSLPSKKGAMLYRPENAPANRNVEGRTKAALAGILGTSS